MHRRKESRKWLSFCAVLKKHSMIHCRQSKKGEMTMERKKPRQLYLKLFWTYTVIVLCIVLALTFYFLIVARKHVLETNMEEMERMNQACITYIDETEGIADYLYKDLYRSKSKLEDLLQYLKLEPDAYEEYYLNRYAATSDLVYEGIINFLTEAFDAYPELEQVELVSYENFKVTQCLPDQIFYPGKDGKGRLSKLQSSSYEQNGKLIYVKEIRRTDTMENVGCMIFTFRGEAEFQKIQKNSEITQTVICSEYEQPVFQNVQVKNWEKLLDNSKYYQEKSVTDQYTVYTFQSKGEAEQMHPQSFFTIIGAGVLAVLLGVLCINYYVRRLTARVGGILNAMNQVTTGNLQVRLHVENSKDELDMIACNFNDMCEKLELYIQKSYLAEIEQKNAQLQALQSQINPHFLYNTLEAIRMKAICNGDREVGKMLYSMVGLFRSQLKEADVITLGQELDYCKQYLELFMYRYPGIFQYHIDCCPEFLALPIIKFVLQPIVENYFIHGIDREREDNEVWIRAEKKEEYLLLYIEDNGYGMEKGEIQQKNQELRENLSNQDEKKSIGITNVNRRIKAVYGEECGISMEQGEKRGLRVMITIKVGEIQ